MSRAFEATREIPVYAERFDAERIGAVCVTDALRAELLTPLLLELRAERAAHSWQPVLAKAPAAEAFAVLERMVAGDRPGRVFTYFRDEPHGREALAVGVVSDCVAKGFTAEGWPVIGRAFVRPAYRRLGLHRAMLAHRLDYCRRRWGQALMAIHLGTAEAGVERSLRTLHAGRVLYLGDEDLGEAGTVRALLALTPAGEHRLHDALAGEACDELRAYLTHGATAVRIAAIRASLERLAQRDAAFRALREFLRHLPTLQ